VDITLRLPLVFFLGGNRGYSSFAFDKKIESKNVAYSQAETYWGAFLTDFFSFFMIIATAATLFIHQIPLQSGEQAALASSYSNWSSLLKP
jgi:Mn2+/Fe2+ NRAMP family transporter